MSDLESVKSKCFKYLSFKFNFVQITELTEEEEEQIMIEESKQTVLDEEDFMEYKVCYVKIVTLELVDNLEVCST